MFYTGSHAIENGCSLWALKACFRMLLYHNPEVERVLGSARIENQTTCSLLDDNHERPTSRVLSQCSTPAQLPARGVYIACQRSQNIPPPRHVVRGSIYEYSTCRVMHSLAI